MDNEFINIYISKQKALIDDLQSRLLLSQTHHTLLEQQMAVATKEKQELLARIEELEKKVSRKASTNA